MLISLNILNHGRIKSVASNWTLINPPSYWKIKKIQEKKYQENQIYFFWRKNSRNYIEKQETLGSHELGQEM